MNTIEAISTRRSIRNFTSQVISDEDLKVILQAGMSGPSCVNAKDYTFIVVRDKETLKAMANANGKAAKPLVSADVGILICGDLNRAFKPAPDYWVIDCSIAIQNMTLAAHSLGIGSVWLGTYPQYERVEEQRYLFKLPKEIVPHSILALGYPSEVKDSQDLKTYEEDRVHYEKW